MAVIPVANTHEDTAKNQHLVPQCYMREWAYNKKQTSVWVYKDVTESNPDGSESRKVVLSSKKIKEINAIENYYDIKAGFYRCPQEALEEIFGPTMIFNVVCDNENLDTEQKRNDRFGVFDEWKITDANGTALTEDETSQLRTYFNEARFVFIEKEWSRQYENDWRTYIKDIEDKIRRTKAGEGCKQEGGKNISQLVTSEMLNAIIKLLIIFDIRGFSSDEFIMTQIEEVFELFSDEFKNLQIDEEDRMHPMETNPEESFKHQFVLHICYDILKDNKMTGLAKKMWEAYKNHLVLRFCLTDIQHPFVTSNRPSFINTLDDGMKEQIFVALPTMLISAGRGDRGQFFIENLSSDQVDEYNRVIAKNNEFVISLNDKLDAKKIFNI